MRRTIATVGLIFALAAPATAQLAENHMVQVVAHTQGAGSPPTFWRSDVVVFNPNAATVSVGFAFFPEGTANTPITSFPAGRFRILEAGETILIEDIVRTTFALTGNVKGILIVNSERQFFPSNPTPALVLVSSRTYTSNDAGGTFGTYGQTVVTSTGFLSASPQPSYATGARQDGQFRTNMGIGSGSNEQIRVHYRILDEEGAVLLEGTKTIQPLSMKQWSFTSLGIETHDGVMTVEFQLDPEDVTSNPCASANPNAFYAYISKVDGNPMGTGDGEHVQAVPREFPPPPSGCPTPRPSVLGGFLAR
jgi:hypothetical protein